jgi:MFS family permease
VINSIRSIFQGEHQIDRNINFYLITVLLINIGFGVIEADFNLYILSMNMSPEFLGIILSLAPFAQALAAIPLGFMAEKIGSKNAFILINLVVGLSYLLRVFSPNQNLIMIGSFLVGTVQAGYFIIQMPFISQYAGEKKDKEYAFTSITLYSSRAIGNLIGGFLPALLGSLFLNDTLTYRIILVGACLMILLGTIPLFFLKRDKPVDTSKISLSPYLHGIDKNTVRFATVEFFLGSGFGFLMLFMNVIFIFYYKSTLQVYGTMSAIMIIPTIIFVLAGPFLAKKYNGLRVIIISRILAAVFAVLTIISTNYIIGAAVYILFRSLIGVGTSLWLSFASSVATRRSRAATSTWLEITFQFGFAAAALGGGRLIALDAFPSLGIYSSVSMAIAFLFTILFFGKKHLTPFSE